ncbi:MAG: hypothetical protein GTO04_13695 [Planctomycetales bacterium]|nr:hypothetical protein [Planctomycetales bacterium]
MLVAVGIAFLLTASAYGVMAYRDVAFSANGQRLEASGLVGWIDRHGLTALAIEVGLLGLLTVGAIGTDSYWQRATHPDPQQAGQAKDETT